MRGDDRLDDPSCGFAAKSTRGGRRLSLVWARTFRGETGGLMGCGRGAIARRRLGADVVYTVQTESRKGAFR